MSTIDDSVDEFGNLWLSDLPIRSEMSASDFSKRFADYPTIAVNSVSDKVYAAGKSRESLEKGFLNRGLDPKDYQLEPGSIANSSI